MCQKDIWKTPDKKKARLVLSAVVGPPDQIKTQPNILTPFYVDFCEIIVISRVSRRFVSREANQTKLSQPAREKDEVGKRWKPNKLTPDQKPSVQGSREGCGGCLIQVVLVGRLLIFGIDHRAEPELRRAVSCNKSTHQIELGAAAASDFGGSSFFLLVFFLWPACFAQIETRSGCRLDLAVFGRCANCSD